MNRRFLVMLGFSKFAYVVSLQLVTQSEIFMKEVAWSCCTNHKAPIIEHVSWTWAKLSATYSLYIININYTLHIIII